MPTRSARRAAQQIGAYDDAGLDVSFMTPSNTADAAREVSLGRVDLAVSYEPDTLIAIDSGLDVISVAALIPTSLTSLMTKAEMNARARGLAPRVEAEAEGVTVNCGWGPKEILVENGKVKGIVFKKFFQHFCI